MSYPPNYGYPAPGGQYAPPSSSAIGFEGLNNAPSYPSNPGFPQGNAAPYPNTGPSMPGARGYQQPPLNPYAGNAGGMPPYTGSPAYGSVPQQQTLSFQGAVGAAYAASAFRQPVAQNYGPPSTGYGPPATGYGPPSTGYTPAPSGYAPPTQSYNNSAAPQYPAQSGAPPSQLPYKPPVSQNLDQARNGLQRHNTLPSRHMACQGTVKDHSPFHPQQDAEVLRKAMKGWGCDEKAITHILTTRSNKQRQQIALEYKTAHGRDLIKDLKSESSGHYEDVLVALMLPAADYDATCLRKAMKGLGTDEETLIEILCTRTNAEIREINTSYKKLFDRNLEKDIHSETSGNFRKLMISQVQGQREETEYVDIAKAQQDAQSSRVAEQASKLYFSDPQRLGLYGSLWVAESLYQAGEGRWGTDESRFNVILASRSYPQLRATFDEYRKICKYTIEASIEREMSGDLKKGMLTIVQCVKNSPAYFAEQLYKSMKGLGTSDEVLIRICVSRSEIDMVQIKQEFSGMYGQTLARYISDDTSGNYKNALLELIGGLR